LVAIGGQRTWRKHPEGIDLAQMTLCDIGQIEIPQCSDLLPSVGWVCRRLGEVQQGLV